jgi:hypothetical protein
MHKMHTRVWKIPYCGLCMDQHKRRSRNSSVRLTTDWTTGVRYPAEDLSSTLCVQTSSEAHPAFYPVGTVGPFSDSKARPGRDADHSLQSSAELNVVFIYIYIYIFIYLFKSQDTQTRVYSALHFNLDARFLFLSRGWCAFPPYKPTASHVISSFDKDPVRIYLHTKYRKNVVNSEAEVGQYFSVSPREHVLSESNCKEYRAKKLINTQHE